MLRNRCAIGSDGVTSYTKLKNRPCRMDMAPFGERVSFLKRNPSTNKIDTRFRTGIWLGHARSSSEYWIGTPDGVTLTSTVKRVIAADAWSGAALKAIHVKVEEAGRRIGVGGDGAHESQPDAMPEASVARKDFHITRSMVKDPVSYTHLTLPTKRIV